jgi:2-oxoglutarate ferredoxin oxidoreductase subunit gamma
MRGGTANCTVIVSDDEIGSPVSSEPDAIIALNQPSLEKFEKVVKPAGLIVINSSIIPIESTRADCRIVEVPGNDLAQRLGNLRCMNMVMLGAYLEASGGVSMDTAKACLSEVLPVRHHKLIPINSDALTLGAAQVREAAAVVR